MKVILVNFATPNFYKAQKQLNRSAMKYGVDTCISYKKSSLKGTEFYKKNKDILDILTKSRLVEISHHLGHRSWQVISKGEIVKRLSRQRTYSMEEILDLLLCRQGLLILILQIVGQRPSPRGISAPPVLGRTSRVLHCATAPPFVRPAARALVAPRTRPATATSISQNLVHCPG